MRVSVIIPAINEAQNIRQAIESCWSAGAAEVIVVDGGSSDSTTEFARELRCRVIHSRPGRGTQQNRGAELANGDYLVFLHADCLLGADCLQQIQRLHRPGKYHYGCFRQSISDTRPVYRWIEFGNRLRAQLFKLVYGDQALFVSRELFSKVHGFPDEPLMEDVALSRCLARHGRPHVLPGPVHISARRWIQNGPVRQTLRNWSILLAYAVGVAPSKLAQRYRRHDEPQ